MQGALLIKSQAREVIIFVGIVCILHIHVDVVITIYSSLTTSIINCDCAVALSDPVIILLQLHRMCFRQIGRLLCCLLPTKHLIQKILVGNFHNSVWAGKDGLYLVDVTA